MKKELKERWITALRSGNYKQSQGCLQDQYGWCCIGVLCNIVDGTKWGKPDESSETKVDQQPYDFGNDVFVEWVKPDESSETKVDQQPYDFGNGVFVDMPPREWLENRGLPYGAAKELAEMNDNGVPFIQIAEYIEENVDEND